MPTYAQTTKSIAVHVSRDNPIFGETVIDVTLDDDGGGPFIVLRQLSDEGGKIEMDYEQLLLVVDAAKMLMQGLEGGDE